MTRSILPPPPVISLDNTTLLDFLSALPIKSILIALVFLLLPAGHVFAADIYVDSNCSLANAINSANGDAQTAPMNSCEAGGDQDTIRLTGDITLSAHLPRIKTFIRIEGNGHSINGANSYRMFYYNDGKGGAVRNVTLRNALRWAISMGHCCADGGATLDISHVAIRDTASDSQYYSAQGTIVLGSGNDPVRISHSAIYNNKTNGVVGSSLKKITIVNSSIFDNTGDGIHDPHGGAEYRLRHVTVTGNGGMGVNSVAASLLDVRNSIIYGNTGKDCGLTWSGTEVKVGGSIIGASADAGCRENQSTDDPLLASSATGSPPFYALTSFSPAINAASCIVGVDQRGVSRPQGCLCDIGAYEYEEPPCPSDDDEDSDGIWIPPPTPLPVPAPRLPTCALLPPGIEVFNYSPSTQCQQVDAAGIGNAAIIAAGFRDGVDVWSWVPADVRVCFRVSGGSFKFLDAATMPRAVSDLPAHSYMGMTCATIDRAGTVALLPGPPAPEAATMPTAIPSASLAGCMVRAQYALNLRDAPAGSVIGSVAYDSTLTALSRTPGWFEVDNNGVMGWIAAMYVEPIGNCG